MKTLVSLFFFLTSLTALTQAASFSAYTVSAIHRVNPNNYTATVNTVKSTSKQFSAIPANGITLTITTANCTHVPGKEGEKGIIVLGPKGQVLLFTSGARCAITSVQ